jgi:hypothetical protein
MGLAAVMAVALFGFAGLGLAGGPFDPNVKTVVTMFDFDANTGTLSVDVGLEKVDPTVESAAPVVPAEGVTLSLWQHFPQSSTPNRWQEVPGTRVTSSQSGLLVVTQDCQTGCILDNGLFDLLNAPYSYKSLCALTNSVDGSNSVDLNANAIRAVAVVNVTNAKNKTGFLGRSVSIPNPCK